MQGKDIPDENYFEQEELIKAIQANDERVLEIVYEANYHKTELYIVKNNGSMEQAKDIYQEAFIAVWENVQNDKFIPKNETALNGYLYTVAKNKWLDYLKSSRFKKTSTIETYEYKIENEIDTTEDDFEEKNDSKLEKVVANFNTIGETCKKILTEFYYETKSLREIAAEFDITEATARNKKYRCLEKLRALTLKSN